MPRTYGSRNWSLSFFLGCLAFGCIYSIHFYEHELIHRTRVPSTVPIKETKKNSVSTKIFKISNHVEEPQSSMDEEEDEVQSQLKFFTPKNLVTFVPSSSSSSNIPSTSTTTFKPTSIKAILLNLTTTTTQLPTTLKSNVTQVHQNLVRYEHKNFKICTRISR